MMRLWKRIEDIYILQLDAADYARDLSMDPQKLRYPVDRQGTSCPTGNSSRGRRMTI